MIGASHSLESVGYIAFLIAVIPKTQTYFYLDFTIKEQKLYLYCICCYPSTSEINQKQIVALAGQPRPFFMKLNEQADSCLPFVTIRKMMKMRTWKTVMMMTLQLFWLNWKKSRKNELKNKLER